MRGWPCQIHFQQTLRWAIIGDWRLKSDDSEKQEQGEDCSEDLAAPVEPVGGDWRRCDTDCLSCPGGDARVAAPCSRSLAGCPATSLIFSAWTSSRSKSGRPDVPDSKPSPWASVLSLRTPPRLASRTSHSRQGFTGCRLQQGANAVEGVRLQFCSRDPPADTPPEQGRTYFDNLFSHGFSGICFSLWQSRSRTAGGPARM